MSLKIHNISGWSKSVLVIHPHRSCIWKYCSLATKVGHVAKLLFIEMCKILTFHNCVASSALILCRCTAMQQAKHTSNKGLSQELAFEVFTGSCCETNAMIVITNQKMMRFHKHELEQR